MTARWAPLGRLDTRIITAAHGAAATHPALRASAGALTHLGDSGVRAVVTSAAVLALLRRGRRGCGVAVAATVSLGALLDTLVKEALRRPRPQLTPVLATANGWSFPSGHTMGVTVVYGVLLLVALPALPPAAASVAAPAVVATVAGVGATRVVLGVHYPSDVAAGWLLGVGWLAAASPWVSSSRGTPGGSKPSTCP